MELKFLLAADAANVSQEGKLNIAGEFNSFMGQTAPIAWPSFTLVARIEAHIGEGPDHAIQLKIINEDGAPVLQSPPFPLRLNTQGPGMPMLANVVVALAGVTFPAFGTYTAHIIVDGRELGRTSLYVRKVEVQQQPNG